MCRRQGIGLLYEDTVVGSPAYQAVFCTFKSSGFLRLVYVRDAEDVGRAYYASPKRW